MIPTLAVAAVLTAATAPQPGPAFLTFESGALVGVDWAERSGDSLHTHSVLMQSRILDATITLHPDGTAAHSRSQVGEAGGSAGAPITREFPSGTLAL